MRPPLGIFLVTWLWVGNEASVVVPPWGNPKQNPCAAEPNGWQLLYWPPHGKCYRIFQRGPPCPDTMELTPGPEGQAECQCPPGTAQSPRDAACHHLYQQGPCTENQYFAPVTQKPGRTQRHRWGSCFEAEECGEGEVYWPQDGKCYSTEKKGPCPEGKLLRGSGLVGECTCDKVTMSPYYWAQGNSCHQHYTQGPCHKGEIFLPPGKCGCNQYIKQYHPQTKQCYPLGTIGPCKAGHIFSVSNDITTHGQCVCKEGHILWPADEVCYHPYTRGPCAAGEMLNITKTEDGATVADCVALPCTAGKLYFLGGKGCHKVGTQGPCPPGQVVLFQEGINTSIEGISYLGMCGCQSITNDKSSFYPTLRADSPTPKGKCPSVRNLNGEVGPKAELPVDSRCGMKRGFITWTDGNCYQLYTQGPCKEGEWVVPDRGKGQRKGRGWVMSKCECRPGFTSVLSKGSLICQPPTVGLARFLNDKFDSVTPASQRRRQSSGELLDIIITE